MQIMRYFAFAAVAALSGCIGLGSKIPASTVDKDYAVGDGNLQYGDTIIAAIDAFESSGKLAFCGVWTVRDSTGMGEGMHEYFVDTGIVRLDGRNRHYNLGIARRVEYQPNLSGESANCIRTTTDWRNSFDTARVEVVFPPQSVGAGEMEDTKYHFRPVMVEDVTR